MNVTSILERKIEKMYPYTKGCFLTEIQMYEHATIVK